MKKKRKKHNHGASFRKHMFSGITRLNPETSTRPQNFMLEGHVQVHNPKLNCDSRMERGQNGLEAKRTIGLSWELTKV